MCVIDYEQMQARADGKYDVWQEDISSRFKVELGNAMKGCMFGSRNSWKGGGANTN